MGKNLTFLKSSKKGLYFVLNNKTKRFLFPDALPPKLLFKLTADSTVPLLAPLGGSGCQDIAHLCSIVGLLQS